MIFQRLPTEIYLHTKDCLDYRLHLFECKVNNDIKRPF